MPARFMRGTPLALTEIEMQLIPGFSPGSNGVMRSRYKYTGTDCDCRFCTQTTEKKNCCGSAGCICLPERIAVGCVSYGELLRLLLSEIQLRTFASRIEKLLKESEANPMFFRNAEHCRRFQSLRKSGSFPLLNLSKAYAAAVFLLTSDAFLWKQSKDFINQSSIHFKDIHIHGVDLDGYAIFHTARDLYHGTDHIAVSELSDPELINDKLLRLIINAFLIRRHGIAAIPT
ncbi:MAG TPA: hypothetical protein VHO66_05080 [Ruminiclostridium sp.]|nr:hypothetical protein [Ruminiclostridium sp.]